MLGASEASYVDVIATAAVAAPTLTSLNFTQGDTAGGGLSIVGTGTNLTGASDVLIGGNHVAPTSSTATTVTFVLPAHAAGVVSDVAVTTPGGTSSPPLLFEYWTPAQVTGVDIYLDANKGVTISLGAVTDWIDQSGNGRHFTQGTGANRPTQPSNVFGSLPSIHCSPQQWVGLASRVPLSSGLSVFAVAKWTSSDNSAAGAAFGNAPLSLVSEDLGSIVNHLLGASADALQYGNNNGAWVTYNRGSGLNTGNPIMIGWTHNSSTNDLKAYSGGAQLGTTIAGVVYQTGAFPAGYNVVGTDFLDEDGWDGDIGAVVVVQGIISGGDLTKLNAWSQQRWGTP